MRRFVFLFVFGISLCFAGDKPLSAVIVGGGPAGLAAAIEAYLAGARVTIIEKRNCYERSQRLCLYDESLDLLKKWEVTIPEMVCATFDGDKRVGFSEIRKLEDAIAKRVQELPIERIHGQFLDLGEKYICISQDGKIQQIPFDLLIGADGRCSLVREKVDIPIISYGRSFATACIVPIPYHLGKAEIKAATPYHDLFVRRLVLPTGRILLIQQKMEEPQTSHFNDPQIFEEIAHTFDWIEEATYLRDHPQENWIFSIFLQKAETFIDKDRSIILIGDAAATASFVQSQGANTALKASSVIGALIKQLQENPSSTAFDEFNTTMEELTTALINDSLYLFL